MTSDQTESTPSISLETQEGRRARISKEVAAAVSESKSRQKAAVDLWAANRDIFSWDENARMDPDVFRSSPQFMSRAVRRYIRRDTFEIEQFYVKHPERRPLNFSSNDAAESHLFAEKKRYLTTQQAKKQKNGAIPDHLTMAEAVEVFIKSRLAATVMTFEGYDAATLVVYDYDKKLYSYNHTHIARWLTVLTGSASKNNVATFVGTLEGSGNKLALFNPLPRWKIAVGNGVYNTLTRRLESHSPVHVVTNRVQTNYSSNPAEPSFANGITFDKMVYDLANGKPERIELIMQMCKAIITGYSLTPAIFIMHGSGGDGKSLFMSLLSNVIGSSNTGALNFSDMDDDSKVVEVAQKKLVLGMDNNQDVTIKNTALLKSAASREVISLFRKFLTSVALRFTGSVVQLCNSLPRFKETGSSIRRRIIMLSCENSHYENGDEKYGLQENIKNKHWQEYVLWYILNESTTPYYTDFNDCDRSLINNSLDSEDTIGSFYADLESSTEAMNGDVLPRKLLYAAYLDWMGSNYPGSNVCSSRTFSARSNDILRSYGFEPSDDRNPTRMSTLEKMAKVSFSAVFGYMADGQNVQEMTSSHDVTRVMRRTRKVTHSNRNGRRFPKVCSAIQYFSVWDEIISDIEYHPLAYKDLFEDEGLPYEPEPVFESEEDVVEELNSIETLTDEQMHERFMGDYLSYMSSHHIPSRQGEDIGRTMTEHKPERLADRVMSSVEKKQREFAEKLAPGSDQLLPVVFDPLTATATEFDEASDDELMEHLIEVQKRAESSRHIANRMMGIRADLSSAIARGDSQHVESVMDWLDRCSEVAESAGMGIEYASLVDRLISQIMSAARSNKYTTMLTKLTSIMDDEIDVRVEELKSAAYKMVGSISKSKGE